MRRLAVTCIVALTLTACIRFPGVSPATAPEPSVSGRYAFEGDVPKLGRVTGEIGFDSSGVATASAGGTNCSPAQQTDNATLRLRCGSLLLTVSRDGDGLASHGTLTASTSEVGWASAGPFSCRTEYDMARSGCAGWGRAQTVSVRQRIVSARVWRIE